MIDRNNKHNSNEQASASDALGASKRTIYDRNSCLDSRDSAVLLPHQGFDGRGILGTPLGFRDSWEHEGGSGCGVQGEAGENRAPTRSNGRSSDRTDSGLDKDGLFRTPIRLKGPSAGQMLMKAIDRESLATSKAALPETAILAKSAPKYSLKTQLWIGAWIFLSIASGVALGFMNGCR